MYVSSKRGRAGECLDVGMLGIILLTRLQMREEAKTSPKGLTNQGCRIHLNALPGLRDRCVAQYVDQHAW